MFDCRKLALLILVVSTSIGRAQTASNPNDAPTGVFTGQQRQGAQPSPNVHPVGPPTGPYVKVPHKPLPVDVRYDSFITWLKEDHEFIQREIRETPERFDPRVEEKNYSASMNIRPEEYQTVLTYVLDAYSRLRENEREWNVARHKFEQENGGSSESLRFPFPPEIVALGKEHSVIINGMIEALKHELGEKSFKGVEAYVDRNFGGKTYKFVPASADAPSDRPSSQNPTPVR